MGSGAAQVAVTDFSTFSTLRKLLHRLARPNLSRDRSLEVSVFHQG